MLDNKGFDLWADGYDLSVNISNDENTYPFAGYKDNLNLIFKAIMNKSNAIVLDIGFGTAVLTSRLYEKGCKIYGQDFSAKMIALAQEKMPNAHLYQGDFSKGLLEPLQKEKYDFIVATYSLHHLEDDRKVQFIHELLNHLHEGGRILIGDVAFENRAALTSCQQQVGDEWDDEEIYFVVDEMMREFPDLYFEKTSYCSGVLSLSR